MKKVLICPLDWGLGHATRCIPVIKEIEKNCEVLIAGSGPSLQLLRIEFPKKKFFEITSYGINYSKKVSFMLSMALQTPRLLSAIRKEHRQVGDIVTNEKIDFIISDNRYGCYDQRIPSAIIIHQLTLIAPAVATYYNQKLIRRFSQCWVPDTPDHRLSGKLSVNKNILAKFIGPLSRMTAVRSTNNLQVLTLVSGPEPHRSSFEAASARELPNSGSSYKIVRGLPNEKQAPGEHYINHLPSRELNDLIASAEVVISRSGYSTIMDLAALGKKAIFVPTPGQTEQLYLAEEMQRKKIAPMVLQEHFHLATALARLKDFTGFTEDYYSNNLLQTTLREFLG